MVAYPRVEEDTGQEKQTGADGSRDGHLEILEQETLTVEEPDSEFYQWLRVGASYFLGSGDSTGDW